MTTEKKIEVGDWVRFIADDRLVIGVIQDSSLICHIPGSLLTDLGWVHKGNIIEIRKP